MAGRAGTGETVARACVVCVQCENTCVRYGKAQLQLGSGRLCVRDKMTEQCVVGERFCGRCSDLQLIVCRLLVRLSL
jgi:hypothetical protein